MSRVPRQRGRIVRANGGHPPLRPHFNSISAEEYEAWINDYFSLSAYQINQEPTRIDAIILNFNHINKVQIPYLKILL